MIEESHVALLILDHLRGMRGETDSFREVFGELPGHTGSSMFWRALVRLINGGFVEIRNKYGLRVSTEPMIKHIVLCSGIKASDPDWRISLTGKLADVQHVLGLSLKEVILSKARDAMIVQPMHGKPGDRNCSDVFVVMPFRQELVPVYEDHIKKVCNELGLIALRGDTALGSHAIMQDVWEMIANCKLVIADCSGKNSNVFYELGIAHTLGKEVILMAQSPDDVPFDIRHIRYIEYVHSPLGGAALEEQLRGFIKDGLERHANKEGIPRMYKALFKTC